MPRRKGHWLWGCLMEMVRDRSGFLMEKHELHGDVFISRALIRDLMFVRDPAVVYGINVTHWADFHKPDYINVMWKPFLGNGLVPNVTCVHQERLTNQKDRGDLFSHMVFVEDEQGRMSDQQLRDEAMTLVFAGHETTAQALTWTWYLLATVIEGYEIRCV